MSLKECPICTTFSSISYTTLNAHIDVCIAKAPTENKKAGSISSPPSPKPRKLKPLMSDISRRVPRPAMEKLERRTGSTSAVESSLPSLAQVPKRPRSKLTRASSADANRLLIKNKSKLQSSEGREKETENKRILRSSKLNKVQTEEEAVEGERDMEELSEDEVSLAQMLMAAREQLEAREAARTLSSLIGCSRSVTPQKRDKCKPEPKEKP